MHGTHAHGAHAHYTLYTIHYTLHTTHYTLHTTHSVTLNNHYTTICKIFKLFGSQSMTINFSKLHIYYIPESIVSTRLLGLDDTIPRPARVIAYYYYYCL
jgi:hypothetical protein